MSSPFVRTLVERAGLAPLIEARARGERVDASTWRATLGRADTLALGAAADEVRRRECGDEARIYVPAAPDGEGAIVLGAGEPLRGTALLRSIAEQRLLGAPGARIVVDFGALGLEIAQVALSFGASDLAGPIASRRGLPLADLSGQKQLVKRREIAQYVESARYRPVFVQADARTKPAPARGALEPA